MSQRGVLRVIEDERLGFWCPGCREMHVISVAEGRWKFDGNYEAPTFTPSVLVQGGHFAPGWTEGDGCWCKWNQENPDEAVRFVCARCHSHVRGGMIEFLGDCSHELKGQSVKMEAEPL